MGAPKTIKATVGSAESSSVTVYWRDTRLLPGWMGIQLLMKPDRLQPLSTIRPFYPNSLH